MIFLNNNFHGFSKASHGTKEKSAAIRHRMAKKLEEKQEEKQEEKHDIESLLLVEQGANGKEQAKVIESLKNKNYTGKGKETERTDSDADVKTISDDKAISWEL